MHHASFLNPPALPFALTYKHTLSMDEALASFHLGPCLPNGVSGNRRREEVFVVLRLAPFKGIYRLRMVS